MDQQRITRFFPVVSRKRTLPDPKSHILELPFSIRRQIYHEAGLVSGMTIHMNSWAMRKKINYIDKQPCVHSEDSHFPCLPISLFAVSQLINDEVSQILYGENQFAIMRRDYRRL